MNEQMDKLMADYEQLKGKLFKEYLKAVSDAYYCTKGDIVKNAEVMVRWKMLYNILWETGLLGECQRYEEMLKEDRE